MALTCELNGESFPDTLNNRGIYQFFEPELRMAGDGTTIAVGGHTVVWRWPHVTRGEWSWILTELLGGGRSSVVTSASFYINNTKETLGVFTSGVALLPDSRTFHFENNSYRDVELRVEHLLPIVSYPSMVWTIGTSTVEGPDVIAFTS